MSENAAAGYVLYECKCGMWGRWQNEREHKLACAMPTRAVYVKRLRHDEWRSELQPLSEHPGPSSHQPADARDNPKHHSVRDRREV